ncbi:MAG: S9 family peptidase [Sphingopyxis sp.]|nr:S9 family peptidase [Sphingopyxis sp.]
MGWRTIIGWCLLLAAVAAATGRPVHAQTAPAPAAAKPLEKLPTSAFAQLPFIERPVLSPDGTHIAGLIAADGAQRLIIMPVTGDRSRAPVIALPDLSEFGRLRWVNDDHVIVQLNTLMPVEGDNWYVSRYSAVHRPTGRITNLLWNLKGQGADLLWVPHDGSNEVLIAAQNSIYSNYPEFWPTVYRVNVATGKWRTVENGRTNVYDWGADRHGRVRYAISYRDSSTRSNLLYRREGGGSMDITERATLRDDEELTYPLEFIDGTDHALVLTQSDSGQTVLAEVDMANGTQQRVVFAPDKGNAEGIWTTRDGSRVLGVFTSDPDRPIQWLDQALAEIQKDLDASAPAANVSIISMSADRTKMLVRIESPDNPGLLFYFDSVAGDLARLAAMNDMIGNKRLSRTKLVRYKARDGLEIEAVLTLPRGRAAKALPFIVMPHGGPWAQDRLSYDYWAQFLAERGYGVIQPNFRGSTGYGQAFVEKAHGQIGLAMQDDLTDALGWAVGEGLADPGRVCIVGASYGGYAAMWGLAKDPGLYRCAISIAGVSNMRKEASDFGGSSRENLYRSQWAKLSHDFAAVSPINAIDRITAPLLLIHGKKDVTVNHSQSDKMHAAMRRAGKSSEFLSLPLADHYFTREADRLALLEAMGEFLARHNPPE